MHPPARREEIPRRIQVGGAVPARREPHHVAAASTAGDRRPLRRDRPGVDVTGDDRRGVARRSDLADALPLLDGGAGGFHEHAERRPELAQEIRRTAGVERLERAAEPHQLEQQRGRVPSRQVRELLDLHQFHMTLEREQRERQCIGDEPGAAAGGVDRRSAALTCLDDAGSPPRRVEIRPRTARRASSRRSFPTRAARRRDPYPVHSACRARSPPRGRGSPSRSVLATTPTGPSPHRTPASTPSFAGSYTCTPTSSSSGSRITSRSARRTDVARAALDDAEACGARLVHVFRGSPLVPSR